MSSSSTCSISSEPTRIKGLYYSRLRILEWRESLQQQEEEDAEEGEVYLDMCAEAYLDTFRDIDEAGELGLCSKKACRRRPTWRHFATQRKRESWRLCSKKSYMSACSFDTY
jgi:hypothetical protein